MEMCYNTLHNFRIKILALSQTTMIRNPTEIPWPLGTHLVSLILDGKSAGAGQVKQDRSLWSKVGLQYDACKCLLNKL